MKNIRAIKKIIIGIIILVVIILGTIFFIAFKELKEEDILKQEIINFSNKDLATDDYSIKVKTTGDRAYVEEAVKKYYKNLSDSVKDINSYLNNKDLINILTVDNLKSDSPNFLKSHTLINNTKNKITEEFKKISDLCEEETIKNLIDKEKLSDSDYYYELYLNLMYTKKDLENLTTIKSEMESLANDLNLFLDKVDEILIFLENNNSNIEYTATNITFTDENILNEYNTLLDELTFQANNITNSENSI